MELVDKLYGYLGSYLWRRGISCKVVIVTIRSEIQESHFQSTFLVILGQNGHGSSEYSRQNVLSDLSTELTKRNSLI